MHVVVKHVANTFIVVSNCSSIHALCYDVVVVDDDHIKLMDCRSRCCMMCVCVISDADGIRVVIVDDIVLVSIVRFIHPYPIIQIPIHPSIHPLSHCKCSLLSISTLYGEKEEVQKWAGMPPYNAAASVRPVISCRIHRTTT